MRAAASAADIDVVAPNGSRVAEADEGDDEDDNDEDEDASDISASAPEEEEAEDSPDKAASVRNGARSASSSDHVGRSSLDAAERSSKWARSAARSWEWNTKTKSNTTILG